MDDIRMKGEMRTDAGCDISGVPAARYGEAVFQVGDDEIVLEISVEESVMVAVMAGDEYQWKGTLEGFKKFLKGEIPAR